MKNDHFNSQEIAKQYFTSQIPSLTMMKPWYMNISQEAAPDVTILLLLLTLILWNIPICIVAYICCMLAHVHAEGGTLWNKVILDRYYYMHGVRSGYG